MAGEKGRWVKYCENENYCLRIDLNKHVDVCRLYSRLFGCLVY